MTTINSSLHFNVLSYRYIMLERICKETVDSKVEKRLILFVGVLQGEFDDVNSPVIRV